MAFSHGVVVFLYFAAIMFVVLFFDDGEHQVKASEIFLANVGENITLNCSTGRSDGIIYWYRTREGSTDEYIAAVDTVRTSGYFYPEINNYRLTQFHKVDSSDYRSFTLGVYDVNVADSAEYTCLFERSKTKTYDVRVMECRDCLAHSLSETNHNKTFVNCSLINFNGPQLEHKVNITVNKNKNKIVSMHNNTLGFNILSRKLYDGMRFGLNPYPERNVGSDITCIVPPQPSTHPTSITKASTMVITTEYDQLSTPEIRPSSPSASDIPFISNATFFSTPSKPLQKNTDSSSLMSSSSILTKMSTTSEESLEGIFDKTNATVLIITGSFVLVVLIVIFVIVRCKQTKRRHKKKSYQNDTHGPSADKAAPGEWDYDLIEEVTQTTPCELEDNILYESSDGMIAGSASTSDDQLDTVLYTVPDKTGIIKRVAKLKIIRDPSDVMNPHGDNATTRHNEPTENKQENQYENVAMAGKGCEDDIPLYAMPNKGPRSTINNPKSRPGSESHDIDSPEFLLYATPDKRRR